ncbi:E1-E2 ATPase-domain-containing protein [Hyaloraphidium curvatum]|nr:E1-E2 ATPase-domain-containing protein [Hyaloraphidium curvatum]
MSDPTAPVSQASPAVETHVAVPDAPAAAATAVLTLDGLTCAACVNAIEEALCALPGVRSAAVTLLPGQRATVTYDTAEVGTDKLREAVEDVGYEVLRVEDAGDGSSGLSTMRLEVSLGDGTSDPGIAAQAVADALARLPGVHSASVEVGPGKHGKAKRRGPAVVRIQHEAALVGVRSLIRAAEAAVPKLRASLASSPKTQSNRHELWALIAAGAIAATTFVVAMLGMMILPPSNPFRAALETMVGGVQVGVIITWALATVMEFGIGWRFWHGAWNSLVHAHTANMDVLIVLGTAAAYFFSVYAAAQGIVVYYDAQAAAAAAPPPNMHDHGVSTTPQTPEPTMYSHDSFFEASTFIIFFVLLGKYLQHVATDRTSEAITKLLSLQPATALLTSRDPSQPDTELSASLLEVGDLLKILPGASIPADGVVVRGTTHVDEGMLTGEPVPAAKGPGDRVYGGTVNTGGLVVVSATRVGGDTAAARIADMIAQAQSSRAGIQGTVDAVARWFVPTVVAVAAITFLVWMLVPLAPGQPRTKLAFEFAISVLVIACPCGLGLAVPTAVMVGTGVAARLGILVGGGGSALEAAHKAEAFAFDKTGTLTVGRPEVVDAEVVLPESGPLAGTLIECDAWKLAGEVEASSTHPLARAVAEAAAEHLTSPHCTSLDNVSEASDSTVNAEAPSTTPGRTIGSGLVLGGRYAVGEVSEIPGRGLLALLRLRPDKSSCDLPERLTCFAGNEAWMLDNGIPFPPAIASRASAWRADARTTVFLGIAGHPALAAFAVADRIRPDARALVDHLRSHGKEVAMLTGDHAATAASVAAALGIPADKAISGLRPEDKVSVVDGLQAGPDGAKRVVAFVGDGINDAVALARANVSIAMGTGSDVAVSSASVVLMQPSLWGVAVLVDLSGAVFRRIWINLFWAFAYNVVGIPIAAGALYPLGVRLQPWMAGVAMAASSVSVVASSLLLKLYRAPKLPVAPQL